MADLQYVSRLDRNLPTTVVTAPTATRTQPAGARLPTSRHPNSSFAPGTTETCATAARSRSRRDRLLPKMFRRPHRLRTYNAARPRLHMQLHTSPSRDP